MRESLYVGAISHPGRPDEDVRIRPFNRENVDALKRTPFACLIIAPRRAIAHICVADVVHVKTFPRIHVSKARLEGRVNYVFRRYGEKRFESGVRQLPDLLEEVEKGELTAAVIMGEEGTLDRRAIEAAVNVADAEISEPSNANAQSTPSGSDRREPEDSLEIRNREALLAARREMLAHVASLTSEELAMKLESTARNASQLGNDMRKSGRAFGVRFGRRWHYPAFQFDRDGKPFSELNEILEHLSPDERGWDRLQWFLEANPAFGGRSPVDIWEKGDRKAVRDAARREVWQGRD